MIKTYSKTMQLPNYEKRFDYLKIGNGVCKETFGGHRYLNQMLYRSPEWARTRREVIIRDNACDLADPDYQILDRILIHHIEPITIDDILKHRSCVFDLDNLICVSFRTHNAIHYGTEESIETKVVERKNFDTCPWRL